MGDSSKTVVCDIDGVLADKAHGNDYTKAAPLPNGVLHINKIKEMGFKVVLSTARGGDTYPGLQYQMWYTKTYDWLVANGVQFDELWMGKPPGIMYIDDKAARVENDSERDWWRILDHLMQQKSKDKFGNAIYDQEIPKYGDMMTVSDFIDSVEGGSFCDSDGVGHPVKDDKMSGVLVYPSGYERIPKDATHIIWFNK